MTKIERTKLHLANSLDSMHQLVTDAELVLVKTHQHGGRISWTPKNEWSTNVLLGIPHDPILISRTEKMVQKGNSFYNSKSKTIFVQDMWDEMEVIPEETESKILALPEHFSPEQLQAIVDGKLKEGKCKVECENKRVKDTDCRALSVNCPLPECSCSIDINQIKLNPHITIYPVEEKMYTKKEIANYLEKFSEQAMTHGSSFNGRLFLTNWDQWFEQNVK